MAETQNYQNHTRYYPLVHYVLTPILLLNLIWQIYMMIQEKTWDRADHLLMAVAYFLLSLAARLQALKAQDRVIRLEEDLRYREVLPPDLLAPALKLNIGQKLALRFAPDEELAELVRQTVGGELKTGREIKMAVKNWRGDYLRV